MSFEIMTIYNLQKVIFRRQVASDFFVCCCSPFQDFRESLGIARILLRLCKGLVM